MKNSFIKIVCSDRNEFKTTACLSFNGMMYDDIIVKIDTGCPKTTLLVQKMGIPEEEARILKEKDVRDDSVERELSFGVNDSTEYRKAAIQQFRRNEILDMPSVSFRKRVTNFSIDDVYLGDIYVKINYDRSGNILIGMDILKSWDVHIGKNKKNENVFLACPSNDINDEYLAALEELVEDSTQVSTLLMLREKTNYAS